MTLSFSNFYLLSLTLTSTAGYVNSMKLLNYFTNRRIFKLRDVHWDLRRSWRFSFRKIISLSNIRFHCNPTPRWGLRCGFSFFIKLCPSHKCCREKGNMRWLRLTLFPLSGNGVWEKGYQATTHLVKLWFQLKLVRYNLICKVLKFE